jgi:hypothetical protein
MSDTLTETKNANEPKSTLSKYKKWDDPNYIKEYYRNYYHQNKNLKNKEKVGVEGWTKDAEMRREYFRKYKQSKGNEKFECEVCKCLITMNSKSNHKKTKVHKNALLLLWNKLNP